MVCTQQHRWRTPCQIIVAGKVNLEWGRFLPCSFHVLAVLKLHTYVLLHENAVSCMPPPLSQPFLARFAIHLIKRTYVLCSQMKTEKVHPHATSSKSYFQRVCLEPRKTQASCKAKTTEIGSGKTNVLQLRPLNTSEVV